MAAPLRVVDEERSERPVPYNLEAEQALIGAVLIRNDVFGKVMDIVSEGDFFEDLHRRIWAIITAQVQKGQAATPVTIKTYLGDTDLGGGNTVSGYLARLAAEATTFGNAPDYARTVRDLALRRRLIGVADGIRTIAYDSPVEETAATIFATLEADLEELRPAIAGKVAANDFEGFDRISERAIAQAQEAYQRSGSKLVGFSTGLESLDKMLGGMQASDLIVIAGRPGAGKSALATNIAYAIALDLQSRRDDGEKTGVAAIASLEMSSEQQVQRILCDISDVPQWKIRRGIATEEEFSRFVEARHALRRLPIQIDATGGLSISQIKMRARSLKRRYGLEVLIVDYLQLLSGSGKHNNQRHNEVSEITAGLKELAKELGIVVIALSQVSRDVDKRDDRRPMLSDLRESGSIEQDADVVIFIYREEYYLKDREPKQQGTEAHENWKRAMHNAAGVAEAIVAKNRHGRSGTVMLGFIGQMMRFTSEPEPRDDYEVLSDQRAPRKERISLPKEATIAYGVLKHLSLTGSTIATEEMREADRNLKKRARVITVEKAREVFGREALGPEATPEEIEKRFREAMKTLRAKEIAFWTGTKEAPFVWLPEMVLEDD
ncbi:MAG: replicative DNA helicase [Salinarimonadaceae bacterium]|nr:MAG: replicative DNA helicase [Salinarimonadaceae bacterium]